MIPVRLLPLWARVGVLAALVALVYGLGRVHGADAELERHEAAERRAEAIREDALHQALARGREAVRQYVGARERIEENRHVIVQQIQRAPAESLFRVECADSTARSAPAPPDVRLTWEFVRLWDSAGRADGMPADPGGAAGAPGEVSPLGPRDLLANHAENTAACEIDRERYRRLIELLTTRH